MGKLHLIGGEKGGVGKSLTARLLGQYLIDKELPFMGFDSDQSHGTFSRFYPEYTAAVDVSTYESLDAIIDAMESNPEMNIVVDLAAQTFDRLNKWLVESDGFTLFEELGYTTYYWHVMDDGADSSYLLDQNAGSIGYRTNPVCGGGEFGPG
ncbi:P-loop NTPase family protein [Ketobacter nezhaii]|uniref:hypothetical protein n=1 Tax=Ketobacter sp. MCCC 1A13808 TaxID=2602738 RepID=UPI0018DC0404|nr:hypothetical protein [Ketobacter sp. MCCC 1A13808]